MILKGPLMGKVTINKKHFQEKQKWLLNIKMYPRKIIIYLF